jgi:hypothetical protein
MTIWNIYCHLAQLMAVWYSVWSLSTFFQIWYVWITKNLATLRCSLAKPVWEVEPTEKLIFFTLKKRKEGEKASSGNRNES